MSTKPCRRFAFVLVAGLALAAAGSAAADMGVGFVSPLPDQVFPEFSYLVVKATSMPVSRVNLRIGDTYYYVSPQTLTTDPIFLHHGSYTAEVQVAYRFTNTYVWFTSTVPFRVDSYWATSSVPYLALDPTLDGTNVIAGYGVTLSAEAEDDRGLDRVEFWSDGELVAAGASNATVTHPRWTGAWNHVPAGTHTVWAVAYDREGFAATSCTMRLSASTVDARLPVSDGYVSRSSTPWESFYGFVGDGTYLRADYVSGNWSASRHAILEFDLSGCPTGRYALALTPMSADSYANSTMNVDLLVQRGNGVAELSDYYIVKLIGTNGAGTATVNPALAYVETMAFPEKRYAGTQVFSSEHLSDAVNAAITQGWGLMTIVVGGATDGNFTFASLRNPTFAPPQLIRLPDPSADGDQDQDGLTDGQEQIAGTDPKDASSRFVAMPVEGTGAGPRISFHRCAGRIYDVQRCRDLRTAPWETLVSMGPAEDALVTVEDPSPPENAYYRVTVRMSESP